MITLKQLSTPEYTKQKHFDLIKTNVKKYDYYIKSEEFYHPGYQQWFTTSNLVIGKKSSFLRRKQLFTFRYSNGTLTIYDYKKQNFNKVRAAAAILFDDIEGLNCIIDNLYCCEIPNLEVHET